MNPLAFSSQYPLLRWLCAVLAFHALLETPHATVAMSVWPAPLSMTSTSTIHLLDANAFTFVAKGADSDVLQAAFQRYYAIMFQHSGQIVKKHKHRAAKVNKEVAAVISGCDVFVRTSNMTLGEETDASYSLKIGSSARISIQAQTVFGAMYGMETLSQLVFRGNFVNETTVVDKPRFAFRAILLDSSRHFYAVSVIKATLDAMAYNKLNVLHWHIVDEPSFPFQSTTFPQLSQTGAFTPTHVYTPDIVQEIIHYAYNRGIRVMPEFDTPGHMFAGYSSIDDLLTPCYDAKTGQPDGKTGPVNPTLESTYVFLKKLYQEIKGVFPDKFVMVGGDEVPFDCWMNNPQIRAWMLKHPDIKTGADLENYYENRLLRLLEKQGSSYMCWQEVFDNGVQLLPDTIVNVWKAFWQIDMARVVNGGFRSVLSAPFYLNYISYGEDWPTYYSVDPFAFNATLAAKENLVLGLEACMWSEFVDTTNYLSRMWPRASAVAERAWSPATVTDVASASVRLQVTRFPLVVCLSFFLFSLSAASIMNIIFMTCTSSSLTNLCRNSGASWSPEGFPLSRFWMEDSIPVCLCCLLLFCFVCFPSSVFCFCLRFGLPHIWEES